MREKYVARARAVGTVRVRWRGPVFVPYAGFVTRVMAIVVDILVIGLTWVIGGIAINFFVTTSGISQITDFLMGWFDWITPLVQWLLSAGFTVLMLLVLGFTYFTIFYAFGGATLGKYLMGLRVVRHDGRPLTLARAAIRTVAYAASSLPLYLGFANVLIDDRRRGFHDLLAGTVVVHSWEARPDETFLAQAIQRVEKH